MLLTYLDQNGLSQAEFARMIGISRSHLNALVKGTRGASGAVLARIEAATGGQITARSFFAEVAPVGAGSDAGEVAA